VNGLEEEATICEWPCNLAVDIAIIAASGDVTIDYSQIDFSTLFCFVK
jgi:hypothetical protein